MKTYIYSTTQLKASNCRPAVVVVRPYMRTMQSFLLILHVGGKTGVKMVLRSPPLIVDRVMEFPPKSRPTEPPTVLTELNNQDLPYFIDVLKHRGLVCLMMRH